jgi:hypothetical protein
MKELFFSIIVSSVQNNFEIKNLFRINKIFQFSSIIFELIPTSPSPTDSAESGDLLLPREGFINSNDLMLIFLSEHCHILFY